MKILQLSDFHITEENFDLAKKRINELANVIKEENIKVDVLIFCGDFVDARYISTKSLNDYAEERGLEQDKELEYYTSNSGFYEEYNKIVHEKYVDLIDKSVIVLSEIRNELKKGNNNLQLIVCCGNHDRLRNYPLNEIECNKKADKFEYREEFEILENKVSDLGAIFSVGNTVEKLQIEGKEYNFVILNSNVVYEKKNNLCCWNCGSIENIVSDLNGSDRKNNILVSHHPFDSFCENTRYEYEGKDQPELKKLKDACSIHFCGDKHTLVNNILDYTKVFIAGNRIDSDIIRYNYVDYKYDNNEIACKVFSYKDNEWIITPEYEAVKKVFKLSKDYVKKRAFNLMFGEDEVTLKDNDSCYSIIKSNKLSNIDLLFKIMINDRTPLGNVKCDSNIFNSIIEMMEGCEKPVSCYLKGKHGTGKSTFIGILYLYGLYLWKSGQIDAVPFVFDIDCVIKGYRPDDKEPCISKESIDGLVNYVCKKYDDYYNSCCKLLKDINANKAIFFIDGLETKDIYGVDHTATIETHISDAINLQKEKYNFLLCMNENKAVQNKRISFLDVKACDNLLYMNSLRAFDIEGSIGRMITYYLQILDYTDSDIPRLVKECEEYIENVKIREIDFHFVCRYFENIPETKGKLPRELFAERQKNLLNTAKELLGRTTKSLVEGGKVAHQIYYKGQSLVEIINKKIVENESFLLDYFMVIKNKPDVVDVIIAEAYAEAVRTDDEEELGLLNLFLSHDLAGYVRGTGELTQYITKEWYNKYKSKYGVYLYSNLLYLVSKKGEEIRDIENKISDIIGEQKSETDPIDELLREHSNRMAKAVIESEKNGQIKFIHYLLNNKEARAFHRIFQMCFYGDRDLVDFQSIKDVYNNNKTLKGFDYENCFNILHNKVKRGLSGDTKKMYKTMAIDLYTICDLTYSRLTQRSSWDDQEKKDIVPIFYYWKRRGTAIGILTRLVSLIDEYEKHFSSVDERFTIYLSHAKEIFDKALEEIETRRKTEENVEQLFESETMLFDKICGLKEVNRVGWQINDDRPITKDELLEIQNKDSYETEMETIFETLYLAQLFLPEVFEGEHEKNYSKRRIIDIIFFFNVGKIKTGDWPPILADKQFDEEIKKDFSDSVLQIVGMSSFDICEIDSELIKEFQSKTKSLNYLIAEDMFSIQLEYKFRKLVCDKKIGFEENRIKSFVERINEEGLKTELGHQIHKKLFPVTLNDYIKEKIPTISI